MIKKIALAAVVTVWVILWLNYIARDLFKHGFIREYSVLAKSNAEEKHAHTYGERFYGFLEFAKANIPAGAHYDFAGLEEFSIDWRRGVYYMYPCLGSSEPKYFLVYDLPGYTRNGYSGHAKLDNGRFILKKK